MSSIEKQVSSLRQLVWALACSHLFVLVSVSYLLASAIEPSWQVITLNLWIPALIGAGVGLWFTRARKLAKNT